MKKVIRFFNKTREHVLEAYEMLKKRYTKVEFIISDKKCLCCGYFIVEGTGKRQLKYV